MQLSKFQRFQGFKFEVTKQHGKYQHLKNVSIRNIKCRCGDKVTWEISTFEICQTSKMKRFAQTVIT